MFLFLGIDPTTMFRQSFYNETFQILHAVLFVQPILKVIPVLPVSYRARYLVQHVDIHGVLAGFNAADVSGGDARNLSELLLLPALGGAHRTDALAHGLTLIINYLVFFHIAYIVVTLSDLTVMSRAE